MLMFLIILRLNVFLKEFMIEIHVQGFDMPLNIGHVCKLFRDL